MRQDYSWVPWFRALVANILANGRDWLVDRARSVHWGNDNPAILQHGAENVDPFSFLYFLAGYAGESRATLLRPVYESVHDKFDIGEEFPKACEENNLVIPAPSANFLFHDGEPSSTELLWNLFRHAADADSANGDRMSEGFADVLSVPDVSVDKLTETLFLIDPEKFLPVDRQIIDPMSRYLDTNFPQVEQSIKQDGYILYKEIVGRIRRAFPGCHPYEIQAFLFHHGQEALVGPDPGVFQVSSNVFDEPRPKDLWSQLSSGGSDGRRTFDEDHCVYVGGPGRGFKYPLDEPERGDVVLVRFKQRQGRAIGIVEKNGYSDVGGFREDAAIHVFWINKTSVDGLPAMRRHGFSQAVGVEKAFRSAGEYKVSFDLLDKLRDPAEGTPWANRPDLTEAALAKEYPDVLDPEMWDAEATGGPPPGPREFWIAEQFGLTGKKAGHRLAMAMYARKGLGAKRSHYIAAWRRSSESRGSAGNVFLKFDRTSKQYRKAPPDGFVVRRAADYYYRVIRTADDAMDANETIDPPSEVESPQTDIDLQRPLNTILYGPPGTGKTYATRKRCVSICDDADGDFSDDDVRDRYEELVDDEQVEFVTFHQSYGYEEFVEGLRPRAGDGTAGFALVAEDGVLKRIAERAREAHGTPHVLVIDEINRANVSKVMGELVTLLEEDKREGAPNEIGVTLPHSRERFTLPPNLHILGTMNTADRSIALLDTALRRRFTFEELAPDPDKLSNVDGVDLPKVLRAINERLEWLHDRDHLIGHAWFMSASDREGLDRIMRNKIIPLIAEYFYDDWTKVQAVLGGGGDFVQSRKLSLPPGIEDDTGDDRYRWTIRPAFDDDAYDRLVSGRNAAKPGDDE